MDFEDISTKTLINKIYLEQFYIYCIFYDTISDKLSYIKYIWILNYINDYHLYLFCISIQQYRSTQWKGNLYHDDVEPLPLPAPIYYANSISYQSSPWKSDY